MAADALAAIGTPAAMDALMAPLAARLVTSKRHPAMGGLEKAGLSAVAPLTAALHNGNAVVRANAAEMLGWLKPASAVTDLARLLSDPDPTVHAQAARALGETLAPALRFGACAGVGTAPALGAQPDAHFGAIGCTTSGGRTGPTGRVARCVC